MTWGSTAGRCRCRVPGFKACLAAQGGKLPGMSRRSSRTTSSAAASGTVSCACAATAAMPGARPGRIFPPMRISETHGAISRPLKSADPCLRISLLPAKPVAARAMSTSILPISVPLQPPVPVDPQLDPHPGEMAALHRLTPGCHSRSPRPGAHPVLESSGPAAMLRTMVGPPTTPLERRLDPLRDPFLEFIGDDRSVLEPSADGRCDAAGTGPGAQPLPPVR